MAYKLICVDVDGTLLNTKHKITNRTQAVLSEAHRRGVHIVVTTGRIYTDAAYYADLIGTVSPVIAANGAFIKGKTDNKVIFKDALGEYLSLELLEKFRKHQIKPYFCTPEKFYYGNIMFKVFYIGTKLLGIRSNKLDMEYIYSWKQWQHVLRKEKDNMIKCEIIYRDGSLITELHNELKHSQQLEIVGSSQHNIEITRKGVSKGNAVTVLASLYRLTRQEIIAFGDSENDLSMIEYAGLGIAMGNAPDSVKQKADYITDSNDNEGVANAVNKFVLHNTFD